jgi:hypothetical protein
MMIFAAVSEQVMTLSDCNFHVQEATIVSQHLDSEMDHTWLIQAQFRNSRWPRKSKVN